MNSEEITAAIEAPHSQDTTATTMTSTSTVTTTTSSSGTVSSSGTAQLPVGLNTSAPGTPLRTVPLPLVMNAPTPGRVAVMSSRPVFMPDSFSGQDREWADWSDQFDMASEVNGWNDNKKLKMMALLLTGKAREMYWGLAPEARNSYASLKRAMSNLLGPNKQADWNRAELHRRERGANENTRDFGNAIRRLADKAYPTVDLPTRDLLAKDQYIAKIGNGEIRMQLRSAKPQNLEAAIEIASELEQIRALEKRETTTVLNMFSEEAPRDMLSMQTELYKLQQEVCELRARTDRPRSGQGRGRPNQSMVPQSNRGRERFTAAGNRTCWECGCDRHIRSQCPYVQGNASGWQ